MYMYMDKQTWILSMSGTKSISSSPNIKSGELEGLSALNITSPEKDSNL